MLKQINYIIVEWLDVIFSHSQIKEITLETESLSLSRSLFRLLLLYLNLLIFNTMNIGGELWKIIY
ncbi:hypothetical protein AB668_05240 [Mycoplasma sp. HU2014]|nr:hypothetical protein AB668_05240 [Mycoplasma sp. HU2014]